MVVPTRFVGRADAVGRLAALTAEPGLVTVIGPGGVGKTRLVSEVCATHAPDAKIGWLACLPGGAGADQIADALGFESADAAGLVTAERPELIVLDNCEHVLDGVRGFIAQLFAATADARVIATSREALDVPGEHVAVLDPLELPAVDAVDAEASPAVQLFLDRAAAAGAVLTPSPVMIAAVAELCRRLDGLPLAIELAAARTRAIGPSELLELMDQRLDVLQRARPEGDRHDSMRAVIEVSGAMLQRDERRFFRRLAGFIGPFDLALAHAVAGEPGSDRVASLDVLSRLVDRSLVVAEHRGPGTRYRLLELLRAHARESLVAAGELEEIDERFVDAMVEVADRIIVEGLARWSNEILAAATSQFANLAHACRRCVVHDETPERAYRLIVPMFAAVHEARPADVVAAGAGVVERWPDTPAPWRAEALAVLATAAALAGHEDVTQWSELVLADPDRSDIAVAVVERALGFATRADPAESLAHFERARTAAESARFRALEREVEVFAAAQLDLAGDPDGAIERLGAAARRAHEEGDVFLVSLAHLLRCRVILRAGSVDAAAAELTAADEVSRVTGLSWFTAAQLRTRAEVIAFGREGWPGAAVVHREALDLAAGKGAVGEIGIILRSAAALALHTGRRDVAARLAAAAPRGGAITVLPELFPDHAAAVAEMMAASPPRPLVESLHEARAVLAEAAAGGGIAAEIGGHPGTAVPNGTTPTVWAGGAAGTETGHDASAADHRPSRLAAATDPSPTPPAELRLEGDTWFVSFRGSSARIRHLKGMTDLARLLAEPRRDVHCLELMGGVDTGSGSGPLIDDEGRRRYQQRIVELQADIDEARADNDPVRAERAEAELDALVEQLASAFGLGGRSRTSGSSVERARSAVTYRIRSAQRRIAEVLPDLGRHLDNSVRTGIWCSYQPETDVVWLVERATTADA